MPVRFINGRGRVVTTAQARHLDLSGLYNLIDGEPVFPSRLRSQPESQPAPRSIVPTPPVPEWTTGSSPGRTPTQEELLQELNSLTLDETNRAHAVEPASPMAPSPDNRGYFMCANCGHRRTNDRRCPDCHYCNNCCGCLRELCTHCNAHLTLCSVCRFCTVGCTCLDATGINVLRRRAQQSRWTADRMRRLAEERERLEMRSRGNESVVFIPAGTGQDLVLPIKTTAPFISNSVVNMLYGKAPVSKGNEWVIEKSPFMFKEFRSRRFVVPEIEVSQGNRSDIQALVTPWLGACVRDGSLPERGFEINLQPTQGDAYVQMIRSICAGLALGGAKVNDACGLHVHVDARDYDYMDVRKLVQFYELIEPAFFSLFPQRRWINQYCQPCGYSYATHIRMDEPLGLDDPKGLKDPLKKKKPDFKKAIVESVFGKDGRPSTRSKYGDGNAHLVRYRQLNLYSYYYRGSVEFRGSPGSVDSEYIIQYSALCAGLLDFAKEISERDIPKLSPALYELVQGNKCDLFKHCLTSVTVPEEQRSMLLKESSRLLREAVQESCRDFMTQQYEARLREQSKKQPKARTEPQVDEPADADFSEEDD